MQWFARFQSAGSSGDGATINSVAPAPTRSSRRLSMLYSIILSGRAGCGARPTERSHHCAERARAYPALVIEHPLFVGRGVGCAVLSPLLSILLSPQLNTTPPLVLHPALVFPVIVDCATKMRVKRAWSPSIAAFFSSSIWARGSFSRLHLV
jgi:hypothetical protein